MIKPLRLFRVSDPKIIITLNDTLYYTYYNALHEKKCDACGLWGLSHVNMKCLFGPGQFIEGRNLRFVGHFQEKIEGIA